MDQPYPFAEIDLSAIACNVQSLKKLASSDTRFMAVVKANAYGHGAVAVARTALENGADELAVARFHEGQIVREAGIRAPVLIFGYVPPEKTSEMIRMDLRPTINSLELAGAFSNETGRIGKKLKVHIKIDTGMGRIGLLSDKDMRSDKEITDLVLKVAGLPGLEPEGIYTHFANADSRDKTHVKKQLAQFIEILQVLKRNGLEFPLCHAANSAALIEMPEAHLDMVRTGIAIYGLYPGKETKKDYVKLKPAMSLKSRIIQVKDVPPGFNVSYGSTFKTQKNSRIATVALGYADGYPRLLSSKGSMLLHGRCAPVLGRVCMDMTMIDITHLEDVRVGDEVVAFGHQGNDQLHVDELAELVGTINYDVVANINHRVPRIYFHSS